MSALKRMYGALVFCGTFAMAGQLVAQGLVLSGTIRDRNTRSEISDVSIYIKGTQIGTSSDRGGRFNLRISTPRSEMIIVFQHIFYDIVEMPIDSAARLKSIYLQPRVIPLPDVTIEGEAIERPDIAKDLPQVINIVEAKNFEIRGYVDAGDLLRTDHSVQVEEELSGRKTIAIRAGNPDEVVVMYNGIKMNNSYNNIFDLALVDLEDVQRFEIIKGSNTALYGPEAFSGVINIVPKTHLDYNIRFQQRVGTYRSGNWGLRLSPQNLLWKSDRLQANYSFRRGGVQRRFVNEESGDGASLVNGSTHHTGNVSFALHDDRSRGQIDAMYLHTDLEYENKRDDELINSTNQIASLRYSGQLGLLNRINLSGAFKRQSEAQSLRSGTGFLNRDIDDKAAYLNLENTFTIGNLDWLFAYQYEQAELDFVDQRYGENIVQIGLESGLLKRQHHGLVSIAKLRNELDAALLRTVDIDVSVRHDIVIDDQDNTILRGSPDDPNYDPESGIFLDNRWSETMLKMSVGFSGQHDDYLLRTFLKFGTNVKFPTLFQQISSPLILDTQDARVSANLNPEKNNSIEIGANLTRQIPDHPVLYGWGIAGTFFQNHYDNKFRVTSSPGVPVAFYDNIADARISGFEAKPTVFAFKRKATVELGFSKYFISDRSAFPFKSDLKLTASVLIDHKGYAFQVFWFHESEQTGWLRRLDGTPAEIILPGYTNLDLHLSKSFEIDRLKMFFNASGRNLLNGEAIDLEGIAIRDRRYYITVGAQF